MIGRSWLSGLTLIRWDRRIVTREKVKSVLIETKTHILLGRIEDARDVSAHVSLFRAALRICCLKAELFA
jgi:hypothetical protein